MAKGMADRHPLLCVCSIFAGLILRDGVQIRLCIFGFLGPLGLDSGRFTTPFLKCVSSNFSKKTNNPNPSPIKKIWFGLYLFVFLLQKRYRQKNIFYYQSENDSLTCNFVIYNKGALERL